VLAGTMNILEAWP